MRKDERTPITLLTGFLGSGKTTLLNSLLQQPAMAHTALVVNEFGAIGIDHLLVAKSSDNITELSNGCLCCEVRHDLVHTLFGLYAGVRNGNIRPFDRVIIETTGLAEPAPILQALLTEEPVARRYRVNGVVTVIDAVNGLSTLDCHRESEHQIAAADLICLAKTDLVDARTVAQLSLRVAALNPGCECVTTSFGQLDAARILNLGTARSGWAEHPSRHRQAAHCAHDHSHVVSRSWRFTTPVAKSSLLGWLSYVSGLRSANLLRVKGLINVDGRPLSIHAVQQVFHQPEFLEDWPDADRSSRIVVILREKDEAVEAAMRILTDSPGAQRQDACGGGDPADAPPPSPIDSHKIE